MRAALTRSLGVFDRLVLNNFADLVERHPMLGIILVASLLANLKNCTG